MKVLHWTVDVIDPDEEWIAKWRAQTDIARWCMICIIESQDAEGDMTTVMSQIQLYVRVESETLPDVAGKVRDWIDLHFGSSWSRFDLSYIYDSERPDIKRAFEEGERPLLIRP